MKALNAIIAALVIPLILLNVFGGIVSGIWLAILGKWNPIFVGILGIFGSTMLLSFALMPGILLIIPAAKLVERNKQVAAFLFMFAGSAYTFCVIAIWCTSVMWLFMQKAAQ